MLIISNDSAPILIFLGWVATREDGVLSEECVMKSEICDWSMLRLACRGDKNITLDSVSSQKIDAMMGKVMIHPQESTELVEEVFLAWAWVEHGGSLEEQYCADLEVRAQSDTRVWPLATRIHVGQSQERERQARLTLSVQQLPFSLPNSLDPIQVEVLASADRVLNALHVDWVRKLSVHVLDILALDCRYVGLWFEPLLDVLPESALRKSLRKVARAKRLNDGSRGLAAYYAWRLNMRTDVFLKNATQKDIDFFTLACSVSK